MKPKSWSPLLLPFCLVLGVAAVGLTVQVEREKAGALDKARAEQVDKIHQDSRRVAGRLENYVDQIYRGLRTIARLPGVRLIDRHGSQFDDTRIAAQEIYNNLAETVKVSEVYILPADFDPDAIDPATGKLEEPIITFDELIVGRSADSNTVKDANGAKNSPKLEEIEIHEYRLMRRQILEFQSKYSTEAAIMGLSYPALFSHEVITCDNTNYSDKDPDDENRKGLVYSVPFYRPDGRIGGIVAAVVLTSTIRNQLPEGAYEIRNASHELRIARTTDESSILLRFSMTASRARGYTDVHELSLRDVTGGWILLNGFFDAELWRRPDVVASHDRAFLRHTANMIALTALSALLALFATRQHDIEQRNSALEERIVERTSDLESARKDAKVANLAKSRFLATMSHEIRTPMSAILGTAEHLSRGSLDAHQRRHLSIISDSGQALLGLINEVLDWSAVESGRISLSPKLNPIRPMIDECVQLFDTKVRDRNLSLSVSVAGHVPVSIWMDRSRVRQVLINLIANAVKFTDTGEIVVHTAVVSGNAAGALDSIRIEVSDTGPGVSADMATNIFELPNGSVERTALRATGAGLGLVISRELVEQMGGQVGYRNHDSGVGATFFFQLPLRAVDRPGMTGSSVDKSITSAAASTALTAIPAITGRRILLVEDNPALAALTQEVLTSVGCQVEVADDGEVALTMTTAAPTSGTPFDIILMDCRLPGVDGITAARLIRQHERANNLPAVPIIALTANAFDWDRDACVAAGMTDFLSKPFTAPQLIDALLRAESRKA
jgi:signal transduction histidine kinase/ActR/RegA family two-component response regulator